MSKKTKMWLIVALSLILVGCAVFGGVMTVLKWDFSKLATVQYETNEHEICENYQNISIITDTADITIVPSENAQGSVTCYEQQNVKHSVTVKDGTLVIAVEDTRRWYEYLGIFLGTPKITVYMPQGGHGTLSVKSDTGSVEIPKDFSFESMDISVSTGNVKNYASASEFIRIKTSTGGIHVENISANALELSVSTGKVTVESVACKDDIKIKVSTGNTELTNVTAQSIATTGSTGRITLKNVIAGERLSVERSTGSVKLEGADAAEIFIKTDTGDVTGSLLSDKVFIAQTDTGRVDVPKTTTGGRCEITTDTGDIRVTVD